MLRTLHNVNESWNSRFQFQFVLLRMELDQLVANRIEEASHPFVTRWQGSRRCWHPLVVLWSGWRFILLVGSSSPPCILRFHLAPLSRCHLWLRKSISTVVSLIVEVPASHRSTLCRLPLRTRNRGDLGFGVVDHAWPWFWEEWCCWCYGLSLSRLSPAGMWFLFVQQCPKLSSLERFEIFSPPWLFPTLN
jgi:hypothetical protein